MIGREALEIATLVHAHTHERPFHIKSIWSGANTPSWLKNLGLGMVNRRLRVLIPYGAMVAAAILLFFLIDISGKRLDAPESLEGVQGAIPESHKANAALVQVLVALTAVLIAGRVLGLLFHYIGQPPVIGEVIGGILLGPSLLGRVWPEAMAFVLPAGVTPYLAVIAQLGIVLYMFRVGLELNPRALQERAHATLAISHASIILPFLLGAALALVLYPRLSSREVSFTSFSLFVGVALSITAFPVLARILTDRQMQNTPLGVIALACAATDDVTAWCLLALVVGVAQARLEGAFLVLALTMTYIGFMFLLVRPLVGRWLRGDPLSHQRLSHGIAAVIFTGLLLSALATEAIGIHAIFGAFLLGAIIPHDSVIAQSFTRKLDEIVTVLLLPAFFAITGMRTQIGLVSGLEQWLLCAAVIIVATAGKFGGTLISARLTGLGWHDSTGLAVLMNTRGLMELIVLNVGLDLKIISPTLFAMMVLMALVTTMATTPILQVLKIGVGTRREA